MNEPPFICSEYFILWYLIALLFNIMKNCSEAEMHTGLNWTLNPFRSIFTIILVHCLLRKACTIRIIPLFPLFYHFYDQR